MKNVTGDAESRKRMPLRCSGLVSTTSRDRIVARHTRHGYPSTASRNFRNSPRAQSPPFEFRDRCNGNEFISRSRRALSYRERRMAPTRSFADISYREVSVRLPRNLAIIDSQVKSTDRASFSTSRERPLSSIVELAVAR